MRYLKYLLYFMSSLKNNKYKINNYTINFVFGFIFFIFVQEICLTFFIYLDVFVFFFIISIILNFNMMCNIIEYIFINFFFLSSHFLRPNHSNVYILKFLLHYPYIFIKLSIYFVL